MSSKKSKIMCYIFTPIAIVALVVIVYFTSRDNETTINNGITTNNGNSTHKGNSTHSPPSNNDGSLIIAAYVASWALSDGFKVDESKAAKISHLNYAFSNVGNDGAIVLADPESDNANFKQLRSLKEKFRHLKVSLSIGGWSDGPSNFPSTAAQASSRKKFAETAIDHVKNLGLDGIDVDWEYPKNDKEANDFTLLLKEIREALDGHQKENDADRILLSVAVPAGPEDYKLLKLKDMNNYVDIFYIMTYDLAGDFDDVTGYQSALYNDGNLDVDQAIKGYKDGGVPSNKIVMGMPVYGRGFSDTENKTGSPFHGVPKGEGDDNGVYAYKYLPQPNAVEYYDDKKVASWSYDKGKREFVTYDNPKVVEAKCDYVQKNNLLGVMFWELSEDADGERSLLDTAYNKLGSKM